MTMNLDGLKSRLQKDHDTTENLPMRWGYQTGSTYRQDAGGCFYGVQSLLNYREDNRADAIYTVFHGDGPVYDFDELTSFEKQQQVQKASRAFNKYEGTARSLRWVNFLLSDTSPWKALHPHLLQEPDFINNAGFIYTDLDKLPRKLWYNFILATRFPWELPVNFGTWLLLQDRCKMEPNKALFIACNFTLAEGAKSLEEGPWTICYPWSFLEYVGLDAAGRFIKSRPATTANKGHCSPNVEPLWVTSPNAKWVNLTDKLALENQGMTLQKISDVVDTCVTEQEARW